MTVRTSIVSSPTLLFWPYRGTLYQGAGCSICNPVPLNASVLPFVGAGAFPHSLFYCPANSSSSDASCSGVARTPAPPPDGPRQKLKKAPLRYGCVLRSLGAPSSPSAGAPAPTPRPGLGSCCKTPRADGAPMNATAAAVAAVVATEATCTGHTALIHDVALNQTGRRMASCGTDRSILIWDLETVDGRQKFTLSGRIPNAHTASVMKLSWAHSTYGQMLVSCGLDKQIRLWQETRAGGEKTWKVLWNTPVERGVTDVKFAPRQFGLKIAHGSLEGGIQTWVASGSNFAQWSREGQCEVSKGGNQRLGVTCLDWNPSTLEDTEMLVIGTDVGMVQILNLSGQSTRDKWQPMALTHDGEEGQSPMEHAAAIVDVAWSPSLGRRYHLIASCSKDGALMIHKLLPHNPDPAASIAGTREFRVVRVFEGEGVHSSSNIWRVSWNLTGTTVASSGDDGRVMLWQQAKAVDDATGERTWEQTRTIQPQLPPSEA